MKKFSLLISLYLILISLNVKAQLIVKNSSNTATSELQFCSQNQNVISIQIKELYDSYWDYSIKKSTSNILTLKLPASENFTFANNSTSNKINVNISNPTNIISHNISYSSKTITFTFEHGTNTEIDNIELINVKINTPADYNVNSVNLTIENNFLFHKENAVADPVLVAPIEIALTSTAPTLEITGDPYCYSSTAQDITFSCSASADVLVRDVFFPHKA